MEAFQHHAASVINTSGDRQFDLLLIEPKDFELVNYIFGKTEGDRVITNLAYRGTGRGNGRCLFYCK